MDLILGLRRSPGEGHGDPLQYSCREESPWTEEPGGLQSIVSQNQICLKQLSTLNVYDKNNYILLAMEKGLKLALLSLKHSELIYIHTALDQKDQ